MEAEKQSACLSTQVLIAPFNPQIIFNNPNLYFQCFALTLPESDRSLSLRYLVALTPETGRTQLGDRLFTLGIA
jgi:hypothetical protein